MPCCLLHAGATCTILIGLVPRWVDGLFKLLADGLHGQLTTQNMTHYVIVALCMFLQVYLPVVLDAAHLHELHRFNRVRAITPDCPKSS